MGKGKSRLSDTPIYMKIIIMACVFIVLIILTGIYNYRVLHNATNIESVDSLSGQRIGCCVGWETDYILSDRTDITLLRYDTNSEALEALGTGQIDALGMDEADMNSVLERTSGLEKLPDSLGKMGFTYLIAQSRKDLCDEINEYIINFRNSDEFEDFNRRAISGDDRSSEIPEITDGKKILKIGYSVESYPTCYMDDDGNPAGFNIEFVKMFAYDCGYTIEWHPAGESSGVMELNNNKIDLLIFDETDVYRTEFEEIGNGYMTEAIAYSNVYLLKVAEGQKMKILSDIE